MERTVTRKRNLPAFSLSLADLDVLIEKLKSHIPRERAKVEIRVSLRGEDLRFETVEEMREFAQLPDRLNRLWVRLLSGRQSIDLTALSVFGAPAAVSASGDSEAWSAAAVEECLSYLQSFRAWYWWLRRALFWIAILLFWFGFPLTTLLENRGLVTSSQSTVLTAVLLLVGVLLMIVYFSRGAMPAAELVVRERESFIRKYGTELTLLLALLTLVVAIVGLFD